MRPSNKFVLSLFSLLIASSLLFQACAQVPAAPVGQALQAQASVTAESQTEAQPAATATAQPSPTPLPTREPTPTAAPACLSADGNLPAVVLEALGPSLAEHPCLSNTEERVNLVFTNDLPLSQWVYALVAPFNTVNDDFSGNEFIEYWEGITEKPFSQLAMTESTKTALIATFGEPRGVTVLQAESALADFLWHSPETWAVVPFEALEPRLKVISMDGNSPIRKDFDPETYPLIVGIGSDHPEKNHQLLESLKSVLPASNRDPKKLTTVAVSGTTALVRATAYAMEQEGIEKPAEVLGEILREADITHVSNEVAYAEDCPYPNPVTQSMTFCAPYSYNKVLEDIGTDVVDLTGDHVVDWGFEPLSKTIEFYRKLGWQTFGGGLDLEDAQKPAFFDVNGNKIAFVGCNAKHAGFNIATPNNPGTLDCDMDFLNAQVRSLKAEGYTVIATFQHYEDYGWFPNTALAYDAEQTALAGADIVSGSQAHRPQIYSFFGAEGRNFVHYGLGNLFFDQILLGNDCDRGFVDRHVIYDGKYISTELLTLIIPNFLQPVWMNEADRATLLGRLHYYSDLYRAE